MINTTEAFNLFAKKYYDKYKNEKLEPGDKKIAVLKNCTMIVEVNEYKKVNIEILNDTPIFIDESLDMYEEVQNAKV